MSFLSHFKALLYKNTKDTFKNMEVLILYLIYPLVAVFLTNTSIEGAESFFIVTFATMHYVFTPIVSTANLVAEEKGKNTLRSLRLSGVSSFQYYLSTAFFIMLLNLVTSLSFILIGKLDFKQSLLLLFAGFIGNIISILIGMCIGIFSSSTTAANGIAVPFSCVFAFIPMLSVFNQNITKVSKYLYGQKIFDLIMGIQQEITDELEYVLVFLSNAIIIGAFYVLISRKMKRA